ncbi:50S ribosomal protein L23 [Candidatus Woesearchaeota archaeon]|nr:50S ribosomal protein L23 [Candidatus Woesearchaeota archaeon]
MNPFQIIKQPVSSEKAVRLMESDNKLTFIVNLKSTKKEIKDALKIGFDIDTEKVRTVITPSGKKKAYITLPKDKAAIDVATQLGIM